jgi:hypothetical protein
MTLTDIGRVDCVFFSSALAHCLWKDSKLGIIMFNAMKWKCFSINDLAALANKVSLCSSFAPS